jgi:Ulp1 family protease
METTDPEARVSLPMLLSELTGFAGDLVFIPINNPDFHWSLLVYNCERKEFWHWDTLRGRPNQEYVKPLVEELLKHLLNTNSPDLKKHLILEDGITQPNTYDCGVAVIAITERLIEATEEGNTALGAFNFTQERERWKERLESG